MDKEMSDMCMANSVLRDGDRLNRVRGLGQLRLCLHLRLALRGEWRRGGGEHREWQRGSGGRSGRRCDVRGGGGVDGGADRTRSGGGLRVRLREEADGELRDVVRTLLQRCGGEIRQQCSQLGVSAEVALSGQNLRTAQTEGGTVSQSSDGMRSSL